MITVSDFLDSETNSSRIAAYRTHVGISDGVAFLKFFSKLIIGIGIVIGIISYLIANNFFNKYVILLRCYRNYLRQSRSTRNVDG